MKSIHANIRKLEQDIERIKMLHSLKKMTHDAARQEIARLEKDLMDSVSLLPDHERQIYLIRKEFGKEF